jgi:hypothetical protein
VECRENLDERIRPAGKFGVAMLHEAVAYDQAERDGYQDDETFSIGPEGRAISLFMRLHSPGVPGWIRAILVIYLAAAAIPACRPKKVLSPMQVPLE